MDRGLLTLCFILAGSVGGLRFAGQQTWHQENGFRWAELSVPREGKTGFSLLSPEQTGITFTNTLDTYTGEANRVLFNGSGVAVGDYDNDGLPDLYFCSLNGSNALYRNLGGMKFKDVTQLSGIVCSNRFCRGAVFADINGDGFVDLLVATTGSGVLCFLNDGHGKFSDVTGSAGTASSYGSVTLTLADIDGNRTLDLYVANNRTDDIRDHGQVDLQMINGKLTIPPSLRGRLVLINGKLFEYGEPDFLYLNDGQGHFTPVSWTQGAFLDEAGKPLTNAPLDWGLTATFRDINGDGWPDLYVCNDYWTLDRIWINDGHGHFRAADNLAFRHTSASSMGVDMADLNRSGSLDILVVDMLSRDLRLRKRQMFAQNPMASPLGEIENRPQIMRNTLFKNRADGTFAEIADYAGVSASEWSWSPLFLDVNLDGYEDLLIPAGHTKDVQDLDAEAQTRVHSQNRGKLTRTLAPRARLEAFIQTKIENSHFYPPLDMPIVAFQNLGDYRFAETTAVWGTDKPGVHHAIAVGDLDGDGDLDLVVNNLGSAAGIYRNETSAPRIAVRLKGTPPNTQAIGAKIKLLGATVPMQNQEVVSGGRYMAGSDTLAVFAAGKIAEGMTIEVTWRNGRRSIVGAVKANRLYEIDETSAQDFAQPPLQGRRKPETQLLPLPSPLSALRSSSAAPLFEDVSQLISHEHHDEEFNDFERQPLLPRKLSQLGPGLAWADLNGDGWDDLIIGSGKGGRMAIYQNNHHGGFNLLTNAPSNQPVAQDQTGIVVWHDDAQGLPSEGSAKEGACVLAGSANYEDAPPAQGAVVGYRLRERRSEVGGRTSLRSPTSDFRRPFSDASTGPLALTDLAGDGNLELFVGGRVVPGHYPEAASSRLHRHKANQWLLDEQNTALLQKVGLVSAALWSDLDGDGFPDLVLACEWGPIRVFKNEAGKLREITAELGLSQYVGWWNGVATGDMDRSGRMAIIASNWGLNTPYHATPEHPALLIYGDFTSRGALDLIEAQYDPALQANVPLRMRDRVAAAIPDLLVRFPTQKAFSEATMAQVLGDHQSVAHEVQASTLSSMIFWNRGRRFEPQALTTEAQLAPAFSVVIADFDGDGYEDIFLSQNFFANQPEVPRYDAGRGLLLRGEAGGSLKPVPGQESGIRIYGEQRGAAVADYDKDGRVDLAVSQNGAATKLFHNLGAKPGLRVGLVGPAGNPGGLGAQIKLLFGSRSFAEPSEGTRSGPIREIHAGSGYWSQDSAVAVLATPELPTRIWVRWPGGKVTTTELVGNPKEISVDYEGKLAR